jgi:hypothetical protein
VVVCSRLPALAKSRRGSPSVGLSLSLTDDRELEGAKGGSIAHVSSAR